MSDERPGVGSSLNRKNETLKTNIVHGGQL